MLSGTQLVPGRRVAWRYCASNSCSTVSISCRWRRTASTLALCASYPIRVGCVGCKRKVAQRSENESAEARNRTLQEELVKHGISFEDLDCPPHDPLLYPALRCCKAFVSPPNKHALAVACQPGRAAFVARDVARLVAEAKQRAVEWKNQKHQFAFKTLRPPLTLVMDCVRSTQNVGSLLRTCAVAGVEVPKVSLYWQMFKLLRSQRFSFESRKHLQHHWYWNGMILPHFLTGSWIIELLHHSATYILHSIGPICIHKPSRSIKALEVLQPKRPKVAPGRWFFVALLLHHPCRRSWNLLVLQLQFPAVSLFAVKKQ